MRQHLDVPLSVHPVLARVHGVRSRMHISRRSARGRSRRAILLLNLVGTVPTLRRLRRLGGHGLSRGGHHLEGEILVRDEHLVGGQVLSAGKLVFSFPAELLMPSLAAVDREN